MLEISGLFLDSSGLCVNMDFGPGTDVLGFGCALLLGS